MAEALPGRRVRADELRRRAGLVARTTSSWWLVLAPSSRMPSPESADPAISRTGPACSAAVPPIMYSAPPRPIRPHVPRRHPAPGIGPFPALCARAGLCWLSARIRVSARRILRETGPAPRPAPQAAPTAVRAGHRGDLRAWSSNPRALAGGKRDLGQALLQPGSTTAGRESFRLPVQDAVDMTAVPCRSARTGHAGPRVDHRSPPAKMFHRRCRRPLPGERSGAM